MHCRAEFKESIVANDIRDSCRAVEMLDPASAWDKMSEVQCTCEVEGERAVVTAEAQLQVNVLDMARDALPCQCRM